MKKTKNILPVGYVQAPFTIQTQPKQVGDDVESREGILLAENRAELYIKLFEKDGLRFHLDFAAKLLRSAINLRMDDIRRKYC